MPGWLIATLVIGGLLLAPFVLVSFAWSLVTFGNWMFPGNGEGIAVASGCALIFAALVIMISAAG